MTTTGAAIRGDSAYANSSGATAAAVHVAAFSKRVMATDENRFGRKVTPVLWKPVWRAPSSCAAIGVETAAYTQLAGATGDAKLAAGLGDLPLADGHFFLAGGG